LTLGEEADFEVLNFLPALNLLRSKKLHSNTGTTFFAKRLLVAVFYISKITIPGKGLAMSFNLVSK